VLPSANTVYTIDWIELYNTSARAVNIGGCVLDYVTGGGGDPYTVPTGTSIAAYGFLAIDRCSVFNNAGDTVNWIDINGSTVLDSYTYGDTGYDVSWYRLPNGGTWQASTTSSPTKGAANLAPILNTGFLSPSDNAAGAGGDNNGFQTNPSYAYSSNNLYAVDTNSGTGTSTLCTSTTKDRHVYSSYNFNLPSGATVLGIEVKLEGKVDSTSGIPKFCVMLSWDGGASWSSAQTTTTLSKTDTTYTLGGAANTWGRTWGYGEFTNANFLVRIIPIASSTVRDFSLDWVAVQVTYR